MSGKNRIYRTSVLIFVIGLLILFLALNHVSATISHARDRSDSSNITNRTKRQLSSSLALNETILLSSPQTLRQRQKDKAKDKKLRQQHRNYHSVTMKDGNVLCINDMFRLCYPFPNIFIRQVHNVMKNVTFEDIIAFNGHTVKKQLDPSGLLYGVSLSGRTGGRWHEVAHLINQSYILQQHKNPKAIHVHNELKLGDLLELMIKQHRHVYRRPPKSREDLMNAFDLGQHPIVMTNSVDENWGFLSTPINTRTTKWINMTNHLLIHGANYPMVQDFLSSDKLTLLVGSNHVDPKIGTHEKLIGLPLGISRKAMVYRKIEEFVSIRVNKTGLLIINNSGWKERSLINRQVSEIFQRKIKNSYSTKGNRDHYREASESLFVLSPSGLGFDTYRLWESILLGSIPIVESNPGFDRTYSNLPVLVVRNYSDITPTLLVESYKCFYEHASEYQYSHLLTTYWINMIHKAVETGSIDHVSSNHPFHNKYCNYLNWHSDHDIYNKNATQSSQRAERKV